MNKSHPNYAAAVALFTRWIEGPPQAPSMGSGSAAEHDAERAWFAECRAETSRLLMLIHGQDHVRDMLMTIRASDRFMR